ncbi:hypothetical protein FRB94_012675 [Tulasnella sp. JGI-2019a]|nr:hypothetical protein FRB94_012675 [Tulasnella sp. JGI-2019a]
MASGGVVGATRLDLQGGMAPKLEDLTLVRIALRSWDGALLAHLRRLALCRTTLLPQELMLALHECKALERLSLDKLVFSESETTLDLSPQSITLSSLVDLCIKDVELAMLNTLLSALKTPKCISFLLGSVSRDDTHVPWCIDYISPAAKRALTSLSLVQFIFDEIGTRLRVDCDNYVLSRSLTIITFNHLHDGHANVVNEPDFLKTLPRTETIRTGPGLPSLVSDILVGALSRQQKEREERWLCPHLQHLHIGGQFFGAISLVQMVRNRKEAEGTIDALETLELPRNSPLSTKTLGKVERIIGTNVLRRSDPTTVERDNHFEETAQFWPLTFEQTWNMFGMHEIPVD